MKLPSHPNSGKAGLVGSFHCCGRYPHGLCTSESRERRKLRRKHRCTGRETQSPPVPRVSLKPPACPAAINWGFEIGSLNPLASSTVVLHPKRLRFIPNGSLLLSHPSRLHLFPLLSSAALTSYFSPAWPLIPSPVLLPLSHFFYKYPLWTSDSLPTRQTCPLLLVTLLLAASSHIQASRFHTPRRQQAPPPGHRWKVRAGEDEVKTFKAESHPAGQVLWARCLQLP